MSTVLLLALLLDPAPAAAQGTGAPADTGRLTSPDQHPALPHAVGADSTPHDSTSFAAIVRTTAVALEELRTRYQAEQAALTARVSGLQFQAEQARQQAEHTPWRDTLLLVRTQVAALQAVAAAQGDRERLASATIRRTQDEAYVAGGRALARMDGALSASLTYLAAYRDALEEQRTLNLWADEDFRSVWDAADRVGTILGLAGAGYAAVQGGERGRQGIGVGLLTAAVARLVGTLFGEDRNESAALRSRMEFAALTRATFDDIALTQLQLDSLRRGNAALLAELGAFAERYDAAGGDGARQAAVLAELVPYLDRYLDALRQPLVLVSTRRVALTAYAASYALPSPRREALLAVIAGLREREAEFAAALRADAAEADRLRGLLERAAAGALLVELTGAAVIQPPTSVPPPREPEPPRAPAIGAGTVGLGGVQPDARATRRSAAAERRPGPVRLW